MIPDHSRYEISTIGQVRHRKHRRILTPSRPYNGYLQVGIHSDIKQRHVSKCIHQLMAITFLEKKPKGFEVAHKDDNINNNNILNLCYLYWKLNRRTKKPFKDKHTLLTCIVCGKQFYRLNSQIKIRTPERGYAKGKIYCSMKCLYLRNQ